MELHWSTNVTPGAERPGGHARYGVGLVITDRRGGVSLPPYDSLNLGARVGDDPEAVAINRARLSDHLGLTGDRVLLLDQCHGDSVVIADGPWTAGPPQADAVVTSVTDLACVVMVADCVPVLLFDAVHGHVGAVHSGRPGMMAGITERAVELMRDRGAGALEAIVGPSVCPRCYEVPADLRAAAGEAEPVSASVTRTGTPAIDVAGGVVEQLRRQQVPLSWLPGCTRERGDLFSHRREQPTGRFAAAVVLRRG